MAPLGPGIRVPEQLLEVRNRLATRMENWKQELRQQSLREPERPNIRQPAPTIPQTGLAIASEMMLNRITPAPHINIAAVIAHLDNTAMPATNHAMAAFLGLA